MIAILHRSVVVWLACLLPSLALAEPMAKINPLTPQFKVFDGTLYRNKPTLDEYRIEPIEILYVSRFWPDNSSSGIMEQLPDEHTVRRVAREAMKKKYPVVVDIEHWRLDGDESQIRENLAKYATVLQWLRNEAPDLRFGYFELLPMNAYGWALKNQNSSDYRRWQTVNEQRGNLAPLVDAVYPPLYTYYPDQLEWVRYARANLSEARRYGKPVYAFLWPQYSEQNKELSQQYLPADYWRLQLETARKYADGIVIWGGWDGKRNGPADWDDSAPWWQVTREFMRTHSPPPKTMVWPDQKY